jgi:glycosyltransferase involved in cell wall biosynthesis
MNVLIIHPILSILAGGEYLCFQTIKAFQEAGWNVTLLSDLVIEEMVKKVYGDEIASIECDWKILPEYKPFFHRGKAIQSLWYARKLKKIFKKTIKEINPDIIFSTQSSFMGQNDIPSYHFIYGSMNDLFTYPFHFYKDRKRLIYNMLMKFLIKIMIGSKPRVDGIWANSEIVSNNLRNDGWKKPIIVYYPPIQSGFHPKEKKNQIITASRFDRGKKLERFVEIAKRLPEYHFVLVCRGTFKNSKYFSFEYETEIISSLPNNVEYIDSPIKSVSDRLEESKVFLYTSNEDGAGLVMVEAMSAGCIPISTLRSGNGEILKKLGIGYTYNSIDEAVSNVRKAIESNYSPEEIASLAELFSPTRFRMLIQTHLSILFPKQSRIVSQDFI